MEEGKRREAPILLEREGARAALAAPEIEGLEAAQRSVAQEMPIDEIIGTEVACRLARARVIGQHLVAEVKAHDAANRLAGVTHDADLAILAERRLQISEVAFGEDRRAEIAHAQGIESEEVVELGVLRHSELARQALADDCALLARDRPQIDFGIGIDGAAKRGVEIILAGPVLMRPRELTVLEAVDPEPRHQGNSGAIESGAGSHVERCRAAIDAEGGGDERIAEEAAGDVDERQHAADHAVLLGKEIIGAMAEAIGDDALPAGPVKECRRAALRDESVPFCDAVGGEFADDDPGLHALHAQPGNSASSTRSVRSHAKSPNSRRSFASMRVRLV